MRTWFGVFSWVLFITLVPPMAAADEVKYLGRPEQALVGFLSLAESAKKSIEIGTFIFDPCDSSIQILLGTLARKARAGVKVRVLLDDLFQPRKQKQILADYAAKYGFEFRFYNTMEKNLRLHIKVMVVDGTTYISGGRNLSDKYFGLSAEKNYVDRDILVAGASAAQATASFRELWDSPMTSRHRGTGANFRNWRALCPFDDSARIQSVRDFVIREGAAILERAPTRSCASVKYSADAPDFADIKHGGGQSGGGYGQDPYMNPMRMARKRATKEMITFLRGARSSLRFENWVYMPIYYISDALAFARGRQVQIRGITNADTEDGPEFFREAMDYAVSEYSRAHGVGTQRVSLLSSKGSLRAAHELTPRGPLFYIHSKAVVRDRRDLVVSSFNLDPRSYNTNLESVVTVTGCPLLASDAEDALAELFATHEYDRKSGRVPAKKEPSFFAKLFAKATFLFL